MLSAPTLSHLRVPTAPLELQAIAEFATWAFKTVEERAQDARMQAVVAAELCAARRMAMVG